MVNDEQIRIIYGAEFLELWSEVGPYTMVSPERAYATYNACNYVCHNKIKGDFVECGVYRGGMAILAAKVFLKWDQATRKIWLFDTFAGMSTPTEEDIDRQGVSAAVQLAAEPDMCLASLPEVKSNFARLNYPEVQFVEGDVLQTLTISNNLPRNISVLRLDTDWYESTRMELDVLYPRLVDRGVVLVDDYGHWVGARKAVDEFIAASTLPIYLTRTDSTGVEFVKPTATWREKLRRLSV